VKDGEVAAGVTADQELFEGSFQRGRIVGPRGELRRKRISIAAFDDAELVEVAGEGGLSDRDTAGAKEVGKPLLVRNVALG
jgi:hypothetical protein